MHKSFKVIGLAACLWAVLAMSGGQWVALQALAWVRITMEFSQQATLGTAIAKTFSGKYPCPLCMRVQAGVRHEQQQTQKIPWLKTEKLPEVVWQLRCLIAPPAPTVHAPDAVFASDFCFAFAESPPTPPPRA